MSVMWIILSTKWELSSVQASLNVIISVLSTIGIWSFTRYWWRRGSLKVLRDKTSVPLSTLLTISGIGDSWDVMAVLKRQILSKENWHLLVQLIVVAGVTLACALAGPIAKVSLRSGFTIAKRDLLVQTAGKGGGWFGNQLDANVLWNSTSRSLNDAGFPDNQLLEFLPPSTSPPWVYVAAEWQPSWGIVCNYTESISLHNVSGSGNASMMDPLQAFPAFQETYNPVWLERPQYRVTADFIAWYNWSKAVQFSDAFIFVLAQSNPEYNDQMYHNKDSLHISLSVLHARDFRGIYENGNAVAGEYSWKPIGPVGEASYSRVECTISRTNKVAASDQIPWPWTNDTASIVYSYRTYYHTSFSARTSKHLIPSSPSAKELFRFYQVYMATISTRQNDPTPRSLSMQVQTVELSVLFLTALLFLTVLTAYGAVRYGVFLQRYSEKIKELYVPDSRIEWMIHAAKSSEDTDLERERDSSRREERDYLKSATFGHVPWDLPSQTLDLQMPKLARVRSFGSQVSSPILSVRRVTTSPLPSLAEDLRHGSDADVSRLPSRSSSFRRPMTRDSRSRSPQPIAESKKGLLVADTRGQFLTVGKRSCTEPHKLPSNVNSQGSDARTHSPAPNQINHVDIGDEATGLGKASNAKGL